MNCHLTMKMYVCMLYVVFVNIKSIQLEALALKKKYPIGINTHVSYSDAPNGGKKCSLHHFVGLLSIKV